MPALKRRLAMLAPARWRLALRIAAGSWLLLLAVTLPLCYSACNMAQRDARRAAYARLELLRNAKQAEALAWYEGHLTALSQLATGGDARSLYLALHEWAQHKGVKPGAPFPVNDPEYKTLWDTGAALQNFVNMGGYRGLFLVDAQTGQVMYTAPDDVDNGVNLAQEPYKHTGVAECWRYCRDSTDTEARGAMRITDFSFYPPGNDSWSNQFIAVPLWHERPPLAVLVLQLDVSELDRIMQNGLGLGRQGQAYIAGTDQLLRNKTRLMALRQAPGAVLETKVPAEPVNGALAYDWSWSSGTQTRGTLKAPTLSGKPGLAAFTVLFPDDSMTWDAWPNAYSAFWMKQYPSAPRLALIVEQPDAEAYAAVRKLQLQILGLAAVLLISACRLGWSSGLRLEAAVLASQRALAQVNKDA
jgi:hypothetical protein